MRVAHRGVLDEGALVVQHGRGDIPALVLLADERLRGVHAAVVVVDDLLLAAAEVAERLGAQPLGVGGDHEEADALVLGGLGVGAGEQEAVLGLFQMAAPDLLAADDEVVAVAPRFRGQPREVGAVVGLGEALMELDLGAGDGAEEALLLLLGPVLHDGGAEIADAGLTHRDTVVGALLREDELLGDRGLLAAVLLGPGHGEPALVGQLLADVLDHLGGLLRFVALHPVPVVGQLLAVEVPQLLAEGLVFGGKDWVHGSAPVGSRWVRVAPSSYRGG